VQPKRHIWRIVGGVVLLSIAATLLRSVVENPNFQWHVVAEYLFAGIILHGLVTTLLLTSLTMIIGILGGTMLALMRVAENPLIQICASGYIWLFRGTPLLVQLLFWYNLAALYPVYRLGIPFLAPDLWHGSVNDLITPISAAVLGLGLNEAAYMAEIVRAGIASVDPGQTEAAKAIGMRRAQIMRRIVLPQAWRFILPPTGNQVIGTLKTTSLVSVISLSDLLYSAQTIYSRTFQTVPLLVVACFWYLVATTVLTGLQKLMEHRAGRHGISATWQTPRAMASSASAQARQAGGALWRNLHHVTGLLGQRRH
jgi:polar amino acid transport system permease protein